MELAGFSFFAAAWCLSMHRYYQLGIRRRVREFGVWRHRSDLPPLRVDWSRIEEAQ